MSETIKDDKDKDEKKEKKDKKSDLDRIADNVEKMMGMKPDRKKMIWMAKKKKSTKKKLDEFNKELKKRYG